jgi:hypothetical protein
LKPFLQPVGFGEQPEAKRRLFVGLSLWASTLPEAKERSAATILHAANCPISPN